MARETWEPCFEEGCRGSKLQPYNACLGHLSASSLAHYLEQCARDHTIDARGVVIDAGLFRRLRQALAGHASSGPLLVSARFDEAIFSDDAKFDGAIFQGTASFYKATFQGEAMFDETTFEGDAEFAGATFRSEVSWATFWKARFRRKAWFDGATFHGETKFSKAVVDGDASFYGAAFRRKVNFDDASVRATAIFTEATFHGVADFQGAKIEGETRFERAVFNHHALFDGERLRFGMLSLRSVLFSHGARISIRRADIALDESQFAGPSVLTGSFEGDRPRVVSLRGADVGNLVLANVDLRACLFAGAHNLDRLRFEGVESFARTPAGWTARAGWPPLWRWSERQVIAEEYKWRLSNEPAWKWRRWDHDAFRAPPWLEDVKELPPEDIARIYRALRKGRDDNKDEAGGADFYYGEMEMRRRAAREWPERLVLFLYWLFSGYALRTSRALVSLAGVVLLFAGLFFFFGLEPAPTVRRALTFSLETATDLLGDSAAPSELTAWGEVLTVALRIIGPVLLGLAVLSLRGRIKR